MASNGRRTLKSGWTIYGFEGLKGEGVSMDGLQAALAGLQGFDAATEDFTEAWAAIIPYLHRETMQRFRAGHQPALWPARKHDQPWPMLNHTGALKDSIYYKSDKKTLVQSTRSVRYAWVQQVGSKYKTYLSSAQALAKLETEGRMIVRTKKLKDRLLLADGTYAYVSGYRVQIDKKTGERTGKVEALRAGRGGIAPRPFLFLEVEKVDQIRDQLIAYVERALTEPHNVAR